MVPAAYPEWEGVGFGFVKAVARPSNRTMILAHDFRKVAQETTEFTSGHGGS
jgi:hypothetical protein